MAMLTKESDRWILLLAISVGAPLVIWAPNILGPPFPPNDSTSSGGSNDNQQRLSRQSALWAIAAIALTNMADLPSQMGHYPKEATFWLKASPLTCLCNVVNSLQVIGLSIAAHGTAFGFERALIRLSVDRFGTSGPVAAASRPIRTILFVLGAIPQAVKLYSCRGAIFSQFLTTCYLLDFFNDELILFSSRGGYLRREDNIDASSIPYRFFGPAAFGPDQIHDELIFLSLFCNMIWSAMLLSAILIAHVSGASSAEYYFWHIAGVAMSLVIWDAYLRAVHVFKASARDAQRVRQMVWPVVAMFCALIVHTVGSEAWRMIKVTSVALLITLNYVGGIVFWPIAITTTLCVYYTFPHLHPKDFKYLPMISHFVWTSFNVACYFLVFYDASRTHRPAWLDWFG